GTCSTRASTRPELTWTRLPSTRRGVGGWSSRVASAWAFPWLKCRSVPVRRRSFRGSRADSSVRCEPPPHGRDAIPLRARCPETTRPATPQGGRSPRSRRTAPDPPALPERRSAVANLPLKPRDRLVRALVLDHHCHQPDAPPLSLTEIRDMV